MDVRRTKIRSRPGETVCPGCTWWTSSITLKHKRNFIEEFPLCFKMKIPRQGSYDTLPMFQKCIYVHHTWKKYQKRRQPKNSPCRLGEVFLWFWVNFGNFTSFLATLHRFLPQRRQPVARMPTFSRYDISYVGKIQRRRQPKNYTCRLGEFFLWDWADFCNLT